MNNESKFWRSIVVFCVANLIAITGLICWVKL